MQWHATEKKNPEPSRTYIIARDRSYHGTTLGTLDMGGHKARRAPWEGVIPKNGHHVSPCYSYRNLNKGESVAEYVTRLKDELEQRIVELGPKSVAAFICEPVVGAVSLDLFAAAPVMFTIRFGSKAETSLALAISIHRSATAFLNCSC